MVRVGVFADTHLGRSIPNVVADYRRQAFRHAFTRAVDVFVEEDVDLVVHAGDLFERRSMMASDSSFVKDELQRLVDSLGGDVNVVMVRGNHDGTLDNSALDYVKHPLAKYLAVLGEGTLQGEPEVYLDGDLAIIGFGYTPYTSRRLAEVKDVVREKFEGLKVDNKIFLAHMFIEGQDIPPNVPEYQVASLSLLGELGANIVIAGHNHKHTPLKEEGGLHILTPGATESIDLSDDSPHGVCILEIGRSIRYRFIPIEPLYRIRNVVIDSMGVTQHSEWFIDKAVEAANQFLEQIKSEGKKGMLRIALRGFLDGNKFDLEAEIEKKMQSIRKENPILLHVEIDNDLNEFTPIEINIPEHIISLKEFLWEAFEILGEEHKDQVSNLIEEVSEALEREASPQTGKLKESDRERFIKRWLKILEVE
jgi:DNA repair exonuclease SbcCD nuclease subunit